MRATSKLEVDKALNLAENATNGPWSTGEGYEQEEPGYYIASDSTGLIVVSMDTLRESDRDFIAASRELVPAMAERINKLVEALEKYANPDNWAIGDVWYGSNDPLEIARQALSDYYGTNQGDTN